MLGWLSLGFTFIFTFSFHGWTSCQLYLKSKSPLTSWKAKLLKDRVTKIVELLKEVILNTVLENAVEYWTNCTKTRSPHLPSLLHLGLNVTCLGSYSVKSHPFPISPLAATVSLSKGFLQTLTVILNAQCLSCVYCAQFLFSAKEFPHLIICLQKWS